MKPFKLTALVAALGLATFCASTVSAGDVVQQIDENTLRIVTFNGNPPHRRMTISRAAHPEAFAHYAQLIDENPRPLVAGARRGGAPGKSLPGRTRGVSSEQQEISEFARFEESTEPSPPANTRRWRGAPGKSRPLN